jgi:hypothetical protein
MAPQIEALDQSYLMVYKITFFDASCKKISSFSAKKLILSAFFLNGILFLKSIFNFFLNQSKIL